MKKDNLEKGLQSKLEGYRSDPPADMWSRINASMADLRREQTFGEPAGEKPDQTLFVPRIRRPAKRRAHYSYIVASLAACFVILTVMHLIRQTPDQQIADAIINTDPVGIELVPSVESTNTREVTESTSLLPSSGQVAPDNNERTAELIDLSTPSRTALRIKQSTPVIALESGQPDGVMAMSQPQQVMADIQDQTGAETLNASGFPAVEDAPKANKTLDATSSQLKENGTTNESAEERIRRFTQMRAEGGKKSGKRKTPVSASLYAANSPTGNSSTIKRTSDMAMMSNYVSDEIAEGTLAPETILSRAATERVKMDHDYPLTFGVNVSVGVAERLSIQTGITYTFMKSKSDGNVSSEGVKVRQKLHYVGLPVAVKYDFISSDRFAVYASAGGAIEKCVSGKQDIEREYHNGMTYPQKEKIDVKGSGVQLSVGANVGGELKLNKTLGLYVEPGIGYYFENDRQPESYRTDKPLNFTLKAGFRINL